MREQDLIPRFIDVLERCNPARARALRERYRPIFRWLDAGTPDYSYKSAAGQRFGDSVSFFLNDVLFDALNECAPRGHYFGSHPGDGSDYGFWPNEEGYP